MSEAAATSTKKVTRKSSARKSAATKSMPSSTSKVEDASKSQAKEGHVDDTSMDVCADAEAEVNDDIQSVLEGTSGKPQKAIGDADKKKRKKKKPAAATKSTTEKAAKKKAVATTNDNAITTNLAGCISSGFNLLYRLVTPAIDVTAFVCGNAWELAVPYDRSMQDMFKERHLPSYGSSASWYVHMARYSQLKHGTVYVLHDGDLKTNSLEDAHVINKDLDAFVTANEDRNNWNLYIFYYEDSIDWFGDLRQTPAHESLPLCNNRKPTAVMLVAPSAEAAIRAVANHRSRHMHDEAKDVDQNNMPIPALVSHSMDAGRFVSLEDKEQPFGMFR